MTACTAFDQPAEARSGSAWPSAFHIAWMISWATNTVFMVMGAGARAFTSVPSGRRISTLRKVPSLRGRSGSKNEASAMNTADVELAIELFLKPRICGDGAGEVDDRARRPSTVSVTAILPSIGSKQSLSTGSSARQTPWARRSMQARKRRSAWSSTPSKKSAARSVPSSSTSAPSRSAPMRVEPIMARRSPSSASGRRVLSIRSRHRSSRVVPRSISFSTGRRMPSWKISVAAEL